MSSIVDELKVEFLDEAKHLFEEAEESFLVLLEPSRQESEYAKIFRAAHSVKGAGAAVGFEELSKVAHVLEDSLALLRTYPYLTTQSVVSKLLLGWDCIKNRIHELRKTGDTPWNPENTKQSLKTLFEELTTLSKLPKEEALSKIAVAPTSEANAQGANPSSAPPSGSASAPPSQKSAAAERSTVKIDTERVEHVLNLVGELVVIKSQLINRVAKYPEDLALHDIVSLMEKTIRELQSQSFSMRMTPLRSLFLKTQRVLRDLSVKLDKPIRLETVGEDTEIDRTMVELLADPLLHMARNSVDHGLENPTKRLAAGKPKEGTIRISARQQGDRVLVSVRDDGGGIPKQKVFDKAMSKGLISPNTKFENLSEQEIFDMLFLPGFSTAEKVSDVSGRGVGMDVVRTNIQRANGQVTINSKEGEFTEVVISLPLTTAITDGLIFKLGETPYLIPIDKVKELVELPPSGWVKLDNGREVYNHRGQPVEKIDLARLLPSKGRGTEAASRAILIEEQDHQYALMIDQPAGQAQVVLKPLSISHQKLQGIAGAAILGDGTVSLVVDPSSLVKGAAA